MQKLPLKIHENTVSNDTSDVSHTTHPSLTDPCDIGECQSIIRMGSVLKRCDYKYSYVDILNDFHHTLSVHSGESETIMRIIMALNHEKQPCTGINCIAFRRNHRNRDIVDRNTNTSNTLYSSDDIHIILQQRLIDRIHCHYFHSMQIGHRFNNVSLSDEQQYEPIQSTKFLMKGNEYSFGYRFFYWDYYKNNHECCDPAHWGADNECIPTRVANKDSTLCDWYINPKYSSFRQEMLDNDINTISNHQWVLDLNKAKKHKQATYFKRMYCGRSVSAEYYDLKWFAGITEQHILSVMLYCNHDILQNEFTKTFRHISTDESDEELKKRHSNFYWWARYLRESVECFGMKWHPSSDFKGSLTVYHGVVGQLVLPSLFACAKGPMSTTCSREVAVSFGEKGIVLEITIKISEWVLKFDEYYVAIERISCFDCQYLSDFPNEQEVLFIGGLNNFTLSNIADTCGNDYKAWIGALKLITNDCICQGSWRNDIGISLGKQSYILANILLSCVLLPYYPSDDELNRCANTCPPYIFELTKKHLSTVESVVLCKNKTNPVNGALLRYESSSDAWFDLERVSIIFPNVTKISFDGIGKEWEFINNRNLYHSVWRFLLKCSKNTQQYKIQSVAIDIDHMNVSVFKINAMIQQFQRHFHPYSWCIGLHRIRQYKHGVNTYIDDMAEKWEVIMAPVNSVSLWPMHPLNKLSKLEMAKICAFPTIMLLYCFVPTYISDPHYYGQILILKDLILRAIVCALFLFWCTALFDAGISDIIDQCREVMCFCLFNKIHVITATDPTVIKQNCFYILFLMADVSLLACNQFNYYFHLLFWFGIIEFCQIWFVHRWVLKNHTKYPMLGGNNSIATIQGSYFFGGFMFRTTWSIVGCWIATQIISPLVVFREFRVGSTMYLVSLVIMALIMDAECWPRYSYCRVFFARSIGFSIPAISFFWNDLYLGHDEVHTALAKANKYPSEIEYLYYLLRRLRLTFISNHILVYICHEIPSICDVLNVWKQAS
eukprot:276002_1